MRELWVGFRVVSLFLTLFYTAGFTFGHGGTGREAAPRPPAKPTSPTKGTPSGKATASRPPTCSAQSPSQETGRVRTVNLAAGVNMELVEIPTGSFCMGTDADEIYALPIHQVTIGYTIYLGKYEVTQAQWQAVMGSNPSEFKNCGGNCPVERVSWNDAQTFIERLNARKDGLNYRLPSESEWEYAARAGTSTGYYWSKTACEYGNVPDETAREKYRDWQPFQCRDGYIETAPVGRFQPNNFGLFDMAGNVEEWCEDDWHIGYKGAPTDGRPWRSSDRRYRIQRGGSWYAYVFASRSDYRSSAVVDTRASTLGFRVAATPRS